MYAAIILGLIAALCATAAEADESPSQPPKGYVCVRAAKPLTIDGRLDETEWANAPWTDAFVDIEGDKRPSPALQTHAKMLWDDHYLYIGAELEEPHVWATLTEHDSVIFQDNDFEIFIDPDGDNHNYYEIEINALNTEWDLRLARPYRDGGPALNSWEIPGLKKAVHVAGTLNDPRDTDRGWTVEMAIPWKALGEFAHRRVPPHDGDMWRANFSRVEWTTDIVDGKYHKVPGIPEANWVWSPQGVIDMHRPEMWGYLQFSTAPPGVADFVPDLFRSAEEYMMRLYYAQKDYHNVHGAWAPNIDLLDLLPHRPVGISRAVTIDVHGDTYTATARCNAAGRTEWMHVTSDSRLWRDHSAK